MQQQRSPMRHVMRLIPAPFGLVKSGQKSVETRVNDLKRQGVMVGDELVFASRESGEEVVTVVREIQPFSNFEEATLAREALLGRPRDEDLADLHHFYPKEEVEEFGVVSFVFEVKHG